LPVFFFSFMPLMFFMVNFIAGAVR